MSEVNTNGMDRQQKSINPNIKIKATNNRDEYRAQLRFRNRMRLLSLFSIYPIWKTYDLFGKGETTLGIITGFSSLLYIFTILYLYSHRRYA